MLMIKKTLVVILGFGLIAIGLIFILLPGPAIICIPLGLALLSSQYSWARRWLKRSQVWMRKSALRLDRWLLQRKYR